jgi:titin
VLLYFPNKKSIRSSVRTQSKPHFRPRLDVLEGRLLPTIYMVNTVADAGGGSLRQAILDANAHPGSNTIAFNIGGGGQKSIALTESLPNITSPVILDATTQPGFSGVPLIELNGAAAGTDAIGLAVYGGNTTIKGFVINNFANIGILLRSEGANIIQGNYIGTDFSGTNARPDGYGIDVITSTDNLVGGTGTGEGNLISGNLGTGLSLFISANRNRVEGNLIGTDISGTSALPNDYGVGIFGVSSGNTIGGTVPGARNVISGNGITSGDGISIFGGSTGNVVQGNYIGTDITGQFPLGNAGSGIGISSPANLVGGLGDGTYNVISANGNYGVALLAGATDNRIQHNIIGTDLSGTTALGNASSGVGISGGASANTIGGTTWGLGNAISGNNNYGVVLFGDGTTNNAVLGNFIGASSTDTVALGNVGFGVGLANGASGNSIGAAVPGGRNIISGNTRGGISMFGAGTTGNSVQGNIIGLDYSGSAALPNLVGVSIFGNAAANTIGGAAPGAGNIISGNNGDGIQLSGASTQNNSILGNLIGTDAGGAAALPNRDAGLALFQSAADNLIGGPGPGEGNVISGNGGAGIYLSENASDNRIQGNRIGTDVTGSSPVANSNGVVLGRGTVQNLIGGSNSGEGNLISGNRLYGIYQYSVAPNQVLGNRIGTDLSGSNALPNFGGIGLLGANSDTIGGTAPGSGNLISGNTRDGIYILNGTNHVIQGNWIGTNASANSAIPNGGQGIDVTGAPTRDITIGGSQPGAANIIDYNGYDGVLVDRALNVAIVGNSISQSGNLGIELLSNGNHNQEFPTLTSVNVDGASVTIEGTLISASNTTFSVEFFGNNACNPSGYGEGEILLGTAPITTGDDGSAAFSVTFNGIDDPRQFLSATATDPENNTSRFSACLEVPGSGPGAHGPWIVDRALWSFDRAPWTIDRKAFPDSPDAPRAALHASNDQGPVTNDDYFTHTLPRNGVAPPLRDPILSPISRRAVIDFLFSDGLLDQAAPP